MHSDTTEIRVRHLVMDRELINVSPEYQRGSVWKIKDDQGLIDSIIRGIDIPKLYFRPCNNGYDNEVVDGQQRLRAIWKFCDGELELGEISKDVPEFGDLSGKKYSDLPESLRRKVDDYPLSVAKLDGTESEIREQFSRLQNGVRLTAAEKRNALMGKMADFVRHLSNPQYDGCHPIFSDGLLGRRLKTNHRCSHDEIVAILVHFEINRFQDAKAKNLEKMYKENRDFESDSSVAKTLKRNLNFIEKILRVENPPVIDLKWGFVTLYHLVSELQSDGYVINEREVEFADFHTDFELRRSEYSLLSSEGGNHYRKLLDNGNELDVAMAVYIESFSSGAQGSSVRLQNRYGSYRQIFMDRVNLNRRDRRNATPRENEYVRNRDNYTCRECGDRVPDNHHIHHIVPHHVGIESGGVTEIENLQVLCASCNTRIGGRIS